MTDAEIYDRLAPLWELVARVVPYEPDFILVGTTPEPQPSYAADYRAGFRWGTREGLRLTCLFVGFLLIKV